MKIIFLFSLVIIAECRLKPTVITEENFDEEVEDGKGENDWFLMFYVPWCEHCKKLEPLWEELSAVTAKKKVRFGKINCEDEKLLAARFEVKKYPTLLFISNGYLYSYEDKPFEFQTLKKFALGDFQHSSISAIPDPVNVVEAFFKDWGETISLSVMGLFALVLLCVCCIELCLDAGEEEEGEGEEEGEKEKIE